MRAIETADEARIPVIGLLASGDARIQVGAAALDGGAYSPALGDLVITLGPTARMFLTGPRVVRQAIGEEVSAANLGGARAHARNGVSHLDPTDLTSAAALVRDALAHLPAAAGSPRCADARAGRNPATPARWRRRWRARSTTCETWSPDSSTAVSCLSSRRARAPNIVTGFGRLDGWPVGVIANQPQFLGGTLDVHACEKGAWFIDLCGRFGLPLAVPVDTPGFLPGSRQERDGVIRHGATHVRHSRAPASRARPS